MTEIKRIYRQKMPAMKLVGRCYTDADRENGTFGCKWEEWFTQNLFAPLCIHGEEPFEDSNAYIGACRCKADEPFQYWIGVFLPESFEVPEGYQSISFEESDIAVVWVYGKEPDIYMYDCTGALAENGFEWKADRNGVMWCFERYTCPRFTIPDEKGNVILDMCFYVK